MAWMLAGLLVMMCYAIPALADGKMYGREDIPPEIPYQRALILFRDGTETLVLQSRFAGIDTDESTTIGWVVPVPAVPEVASMPSERADMLFGGLYHHTRPRTYTLGPVVVRGVLTLTGGLSIVLLIGWVLSFKLAFPPWFVNHRSQIGCYVLGLLASHGVGFLLVRVLTTRPFGYRILSYSAQITLISIAWYLFILCAVVVIIAAALLIQARAMFKHTEYRHYRTWLRRLGIIGAYGCIALGMAALMPGVIHDEERLASTVEVISEHYVGDYHVRIIRSDSAHDLIEWLDDNDFQFGPHDLVAFEDYLERDWRFVVARLRPFSELQSYPHMDHLSDMAPPLIMRFPAADPVYPLALTGTGGYHTEVVIYVASDTKVRCDGRMELRFAGESPEERLEQLTRDIDPPDFFEAKDWNYPYLCKYAKLLTPAAMSTDLFFTSDPDMRPYRERIIQWSRR